MQKIELYIEDKYIDKILNILKKFKKEGIVNIVIPQNFKKENKTSAFGILKGKIKDPVKWQRDLRAENERDIYNLR